MCVCVRAYPPPVLPTLLTAGAAEPGRAGSPRHTHKLPAQACMQEPLQASKIILGRVYAVPWQAHGAQLPACAAKQRHLLPWQRCGACARRQPSPSLTACTFRHTACTFTHSMHIHSQHAHSDTRVAPARLRRQARWLPCAGMAQRIMLLRSNKAPKGSVNLFTWTNTHATVIPT